MKVEPRRLRGIRAMLDESAGWELSEQEWTKVCAAVDRLAEALASDDPHGLDAARDELARYAPRRIVKARPESTPMPEELRERRNMLVHEIVVRIPEPRPEDAVDQ